MIPLGVLASAYVPATATGLIEDSFNRANGSLGVTDTGETWATVGTWAIIDAARALCTTSHANSYATVPAWSDAEVQVDIQGGSQYPGVCARYADASNNYFAIYNPGAGNLAWELRRKIGGTEVLLGSWAATFADATVKLTAVEGSGQTNLTVYVDGTSRITYADTTTGRPSGTQIGLVKAWGTTDPRYDNFVAREL